MRDPSGSSCGAAFLLAHVRPGQAVLDVGCGAGEFSAALLEAGARPIAVDVAREALRRARERVPGLDARLWEPGEPLPRRRRERRRRLGGRGRRARRGRRAVAVGAAPRAQAARHAAADDAAPRAGHAAARSRSAGARSPSTSSRARTTSGTSRRPRCARCSTTSASTSPSCAAPAARRACARRSSPRTRGDARRRRAVLSAACRTPRLAAEQAPAVSSG